MAKRHVARESCPRPRISHAVLLRSKWNAGLAEFLHARHRAIPLIRSDYGMNDLRHICIARPEPSQSLGDVNKMFALAPHLAKRAKGLIALDVATILKKQNCVFQAKLRRYAICRC